MSGVDADRRATERRAKMLDVLDRHLRPIVEQRCVVDANPLTRFGVILWLATGAINRRSKHFAPRPPIRAARMVAPFLDMVRVYDLPTLIQFATYVYSDDHSKHLCSLAAKAFSSSQIRWFANYVGLRLDDPQDPFEISGAYLQLKRRRELVAMCIDAGIDVTTHTTVEEIRTLLLNPSVIEKLGVPADIEALYAEPYEAEVHPEEAEFESLPEDAFLEQTTAAALESGAEEIAQLTEGETR